MKSQFNCPACEHPLDVFPHGEKSDAVLVYCGRGPCKSEAGDMGAVGATEQQAYDNLREAMEKESEGK